MLEPTKNTDLGPALLEYLRNLTPQVLLLALAIVAWVGLDTTKPDLSWTGIKNLAVPTLVFGLFLFAFWSNMQQFLERAVSVSEAVDIEATRLARQEIPLRKKLLGLVPIIWKHDRMFAVRAAGAIVVVFIGSLALFTAAVPQAVSFLHMGRP
jgi:hypothetical protein